MISLEQLADGSISDRNFQKLMSLVLDTGGQSAGIRFGTNTATFTAAAISATKTIAHGLGKAPVVVLVVGSEFKGAHVCSFDAFTYTATTFDTHGQFVDGTAITGTSNFAWVAIG